MTEMQIQMQRATAMTGLLVEHFRRFWPAWLASLSAFLLFTHWYAVGFNVTKSLPGHVYLVKKYDRVPARGKIMTFVWQGTGLFDPYPAGLTFMKIVRGLPGDTVRVQDRSFYVNGQFTGTAKRFTLNGHHPLALGPTGVIPPGYVYVYATHPRSLDSRYAITGWISQKTITGSAVCLF